MTNSFYNQKEIDNLLSQGIKPDEIEALSELANIVISGLGEYSTFSEKDTYIKENLLSDDIDVSVKDIINTIPGLNTKINAHMMTSALVEEGGERGAYTFSKAKTIGGKNIPAVSDDELLRILETYFPEARDVGDEVIDPAHDILGSEQGVQRYRESRYGGLTPDYGYLPKEQRPIVSTIGFGYDEDGQIVLDTTAADTEDKTYKQATISGTEELPMLYKNPTEVDSIYSKSIDERTKLQSDVDNLKTTVLQKQMDESKHLTWSLGTQMDEDDYWEIPATPLRWKAGPVQRAISEAEGLQDYPGTKWALDKLIGIPSDAIIAGAMPTAAILTQLTAGWTDLFQPTGLGKIEMSDFKWNPATNEFGYSDEFEALQTRYATAIDALDTFDAANQELIEHKGRVDKASRDATVDLMRLNNTVLDDLIEGGYLSLPEAINILKE